MLKDLSNKVKSFHIDSRKVMPGSCFVAIKGENADGHDFLLDAKNNGAILAIVEKVNSDIDIEQIQVADTVKYIGQLAKEIRSTWDFPVIAITGSCGKTTTKEMLVSICKANNMRVLATEKNFNNFFGVPLTIFQGFNKSRQDYDAAIIELGTNNLGEINYLADIIKPDHAIVTTVAPVHLLGLKTEENIYYEKTDLFRNLKDKKIGKAIFNADNKFCDKFLAEFDNNLLFGIENKADFKADNINLLDNGCYGFNNIYLSTPGRHQIYNALAATSAASLLNISPEIIKLGLENYHGIEKRMVVKNLKNNIKILDDSYSANLLSVKYALETLSNFAGKKIFVFADMGEIGDSEIDFHKQIGQFAKQLKIDKVLAYGNLTRHVVSEFDGDGLFFDLAKKQDLISALKNIIDELSDATILIKGSNKFKMWEITDACLAD